MSPIDDATLFLVNTLFGLFVYALIARVLLRVTRADFHNPLAQFVWRITNPVIAPVQNHIPRYRNWDLATILVAWLILIVNLLIDLALLNIPLSPYVAWLALLKLIVMVITFYTFAILIQAVMSWFGAAMHSPAASLLFALTEPVLRPFRQRIPPIGGMDLSPLVVIIGLQVISRLIPLAYVLR